MALADLILASVVAGLGALLAAVGLGAYRRSGLRPMLLTSLAFLCVAAGGVAYLVLRAAAGSQDGAAEVALLTGVVVALVLFYLALFGRRDA